MIRDATPSDAAALARIYNQYVLDTTVTFEETAVSKTEMAVRIAEVQAAGLPWLVAEDDAGLVLGHAYASKWKGRCAYRFAVETTVYLDAAVHGRGSLWRIDPVGEEPWMRALRKGACRRSQTSTASPSGVPARTFPQIRIPDLFRNGIPVAE